MAGVKELKEFIDFAEKNRKYAAGTARGRRAALRMFDSVLTDDERHSVDLITARFTKIYNEAFQKNKKVITAPSLETYRIRMNGLIRDFKKYGSDPTTFSTWDPTRRHDPKTPHSTSSTRNRRSAPHNAPITTEANTELVPLQDSVFIEGESDQLIFNAPEMAFAAEVNKLEIHLRPGFKVTLVVPSDLKDKEAKRLTQIIQGMVAEDEDSRL